MERPLQITIRAYTNRFLGTVEKGRELLRLLETIDSGRWVPEKWNALEPIRYPYGPNAYDRILKTWSEPRPAGSSQVTNSLLFRRSRPTLLLEAEAWRSSRPRLNNLWAHFDARAFEADDGAERILRIVLGLVAWSDAIYAAAFHSAQAHGRSGPGMPLEGLRRLDWLTYWGAPYVDIIGRERLLRAPCYLTKGYGAGILMEAAPRFDSPEVLESNTLLIGLEQYLGADLFAGPDYPRVPCRVPPVDMSETLCPVVPSVISALAARPGDRGTAKLLLLISELAAEAEALAASKRIALDYSPLSISTVDTLLDEFRKDWAGRRDRAAAKAKRRLASAFGAYVGEVLRRARGGEWAYDNASEHAATSIAVQFGEVRAFPIDKAYKRLTRGPAESLELYAAALLQPRGSNPPGI